MFNSQSPVVCRVFSQCIATWNHQKVNGCSTSSGSRLVPAQGSPILAVHPHFPATWGARSQFQRQRSWVPWLDGVVSTVTQLWQCLWFVSLTRWSPLLPKSNCKQLSSMCGQLVFRFGIAFPKIPELCNFWLLVLYFRVAPCDYKYFVELCFFQFAFILFELMISLVFIMKIKIKPNSITKMN